MAVRHVRKNPIIKLLNSLFKNGLESVGKYYSLYRGIVFDNNDPENLQRIKLIIPQISGNQNYEYWAYPRNVFYGEGYGLQIVPQKGEMVWVEFEGGEPELPIWSFGHPGRKELPKNDEELKDKNCYWFVTPKGHKVKINDTKSTIHIEHRLGQIIEINDSSISHISTKSISFGKINSSDYHAVLGEKDKEVLEDINFVLKKLHKAMEDDLLIFQARGFTNMVTMIPIIKPKVEGLIDKINLILSDLVTLNK